HQVKLEVYILGRTQSIGLDPHPDDAVAQPPLQRAERLPFQAIERIAGRMRLRDRRAGELFLPVVVVTLRAGEIELAPAAMEDRPAGFEERASALVDRDLDG